MISPRCWKATLAGAGGTHSSAINISAPSPRGLAGWEAGEAERDRIGVPGAGGFVCHLSLCRLPGDGANKMLQLLRPSPPPATSPHFSFQGSQDSGDSAHLACSQVSADHWPPQLQTILTALFPETHRVFSVACLVGPIWAGHPSQTRGPGSPVVPRNHDTSPGCVTRSSDRRGGTWRPCRVRSRGMVPAHDQSACPGLQGTLGSAAASDAAGWPGWRWHSWRWVGSEWEQVFDGGMQEKPVQDRAAPSNHPCPA